MNNDVTHRQDKTDRDGADCCGGAAPAGTNACCQRDAEAKMAGQDGCGCSNAVSKTQTPSPQAGCC